MIKNIELIAQSAIRIKSQDNKVIYFDPFKLGVNYNNDADLIYITHSHFDHFSPEDILKIKKEETKIIAPEDLREQIEKIGFDESNVLLVKPNNDYNIENIEFSTIPAYNINKDFHKKEFNWVGYIVNIDGERVYVAGDTDNTEEARNVKCDIACIPIGGTYTMTYEEAADLINTIRPKVAIPTHYNNDVEIILITRLFSKKILENIEVRILMK